jgi:hypothetical protein
MAMRAKTLFGAGAGIIVGGLLLGWPACTV